MDILVKGDSAPFTHCPECRDSIRHGSQSCEHCGHHFSSRLSALPEPAEQNILYMLATTSSILAGVCYVLNHYFTG